VQHLKCVHNLQRRKKLLQWQEAEATRRGGREQKLGRGCLRQLAQPLDSAHQHLVEAVKETKERAQVSEYIIETREHVRLDRTHDLPRCEVAAKQADDIRARCLERVAQARCSALMREPIFHSEIHVAFFAGEAWDRLTFDR
jgi:hypothetical protein